MFNDPPSLNNHKISVMAVSLIITFFAVFHFNYTLNLKTSFLWSYNQSTRAKMNYIENKPGPRKVKLCSHFLHGPPILFYIQNEKYENIEFIHYQNPIRSYDYYDYFYMPGNDLKGLHSSYEKDTVFYNEVLFIKPELNKVPQWIMTFLTLLFLSGLV